MIVLKKKKENKKRPSDWCVKNTLTHNLGINNYKRRVSKILAQQLYIRFVWHFKLIVLSLEHLKIKQLSDNMIL